MKLKIMMLALAGVALMQPEANAQSSKYNKNYPVCKKHGKYVTCDHSEAMKQSKDYSSGKVAAQKEVENTNVIYANSSAKEKSKLASAYEMPDEVYTKDKPNCETKMVYRGGPYGEAMPAKEKIVCVNTESNKDNSSFTASYDVPEDMYSGEDVPANDGVAKNKARNLNYLDFSVMKVPNDGGLATK